MSEALRSENTGIAAPRFLLIPILGLLGAILISLDIWTGQSDIPRVTVFGTINNLPVWMDHIIFGLMLLGLNASFLKRFSYQGLLLGTVTFVILLALDSARLQPWSYFYLITLLIHIFSKTRPTTVTMILFCTAGVYIWSGIFKINPNYFEILFSWLVSPYYKLESLTLVRVLAVLSAVYQIAAGVLLLFQETRRIGAIAAILMHVLALLIIGPLGLDWNAAIWPWHLTMIVLLGLLVRENQFATFSEIKVVRPLMAVLSLIWFLPAFNFFGLWDSHLSFEINSGNMKVALIEIDPTEQHLVPKSMTVSADMIDLMDWHMTERHALLYPERRVFLALFDNFCSEANFVDSKFLIVGKRTLFERASVEEFTCKNFDRRN